MSHTPAASPATSTDRPGTKFFAPQVRLADESGEPIAFGTQPVSQDIVSAKVTRVNTGVSQVEIVLNNQRHDDEHRPMVPTWRYNGLSAVSFGSRVRVDYRYGNEPWTPMILARITDMTFLFPQAAGAQVTLQGEDLLSLLKTKPATDTMYVEFHEIDIVREAASSSNSGLSLASPEPAPAFGAELPATTHQGSQTYLQFIDSLAERMDYEVFVDFAPGGGTGVNLHFEPARSATLDEVVELAWGRDLLEFKPVFKGWDLLTDAVATGSVPGRRATFNATVTMASAINDLHAAPGGATPLSASDARAAAFDNENRPETNTERINVSNLDEERARMQATAALRRSARQFLTADVTTMGFPRLRPGIHVNLTGLDAPFDGIYYVTQTVHTVSGAGYLTVSSLRRPGMLDPSAYPGG
jgi:phage protein D